MTENIPRLRDGRLNSAKWPDGKIKVVQVIARLNIGGLTSHVVLLNNGLNRARFESLLVSGTENPGEGSMLDYALSRGVEPVILPEIVAEANVKVRDIRALVKLYRLMRRERPHIVHTHTAKAGFLGRLAARLAGVPVVAHTYHGHILDGYYGALKTRLLRRMERALAHLTDCIIAVSEQVKSELISYGVAPPGKITVVPLGLELEPFLNSLVYRGKFRRELALSEEVRLVGIVGRIFPIKNHRLFLDAADRIAAAESAARFVIVGDGVLRQDMERYARALGIADRVIFTGWRRDMPEVYADLDVLVISSKNEGTPVAAIEAMAAGCPVVATRVGGVPDLVEDGVTGLLAPAGDAGALARVLATLLGDPERRRAMGEAGRKRVYPAFSAERLVQDVDRLYTELLATKRVAAGT